MHPRNTLSALALLTVLSCASGPRSVADGQPGAQHLVVDLNYVYWTVGSGSASTLMKALKEDKQAPVQVMAIPGNVRAVTVDDDGLYVVVAAGAGQNFVRKIPKKQGQPPSDLVNTRSSITAIGLDATHVYWTQTGTLGDPDDNQTPGVLRVMRSGGTPLCLAPRQPGTPGHIALSATHVYWLDSEAGKSTIMALRKAGGTPVALGAVPESETGGVPALAADDFGVFYKTRSAVMKLSSEGGAAVKLATVTDSDSSQLALDARSLYFAGPQGPMRMPLQGGAAQSLGEGAPTAITVDQESVYWLSSGKVMQAPKR
jgi:hypothetical protein